MTETKEELAARWLRIQELAVKVKSLADESRTIRGREMKQRDVARSNSDPQESAAASKAREQLYWHRTQKVRPEARAAQLAYAYLRGVPYAEVEPNTPLNAPDIGWWHITLKVCANVHPNDKQKAANARDALVEWLAAPKESDQCNTPQSASASG